MGPQRGWLDNLNRMNGAPESQQLAERFLAAANQHDIDAMVAMWKPGASEHFPTFQQSFRVPDEFAEHFRSLFDAFPDVQWDVLSVTKDADRVVVRSTMHGTHLGPYQGITATGKRFAVDTIDFLQIIDGRIVRNDVFFDGLTVLRQIGVLPPAGSRRERMLQQAFNALTRVRRRRVRATELIPRG